MQRCPLWVISGHRVTSVQCPLYPQKRTSVGHRGMSAKCQTRASRNTYSMILPILVPLLSCLELLRINSHHLD
jgi:hypothetical protein